MQHTDHSPCPHCGSSCTQGHGSFVHKDGTSQRRRLCRTCGRTFNPNTGTPLHYLKKRSRWAQMAEGMVNQLSVRKAAAFLGVQVATAFRWRHRLLSALCRQPQPLLTGIVAASEAYLPYSEKGSRRTSGPGAHGSRFTPVRRTTGQRPFRRFVEGKPSCVLLACAGEQQVTVIVGRPLPEGLQSCLAEVLGAGAELWAGGLAPYAEACRRLGIAHRDLLAQGTAGWVSHPCRGVDRLRVQLHGWLRKFRGVATRYLHHYLAWYRFASRSARLLPADPGQHLLIEANALVPRKPAA